MVITPPTPVSNSRRGYTEDNSYSRPAKYSLWAVDRPLLMRNDLGIAKTMLQAATARLAVGSVDHTGLEVLPHPPHCRHLASSD